MTVKEVDPDVPKDEQQTSTIKSDLDKKSIPEELSEEDQHLRDELFTYIETLQGSDTHLYNTALTGLADRLRDATASMTSVPKPLKILKSRLQDLIDIHANLDKDVQCQQMCAEIISVVGMTEGFKGTCVTYRLLADNHDIAKWGHEYVKHLSAEMCMAGQDSTEFDNVFSEHIDELIELANVVVPYFLAHNAETDAVDLLGDFENLEILNAHVDKDNFERVALYLKSCAAYISNDNEDMNYVVHAYDIYILFNKIHEAMQCAIRNNRKDLVMEAFAMAKSKSMRVQLAHLLALNGWRSYPVEEEQELEPDVQDAFQNTHLSENFRWLARELDILEPKSPKDVYKTHLTDAQYTRHFLIGTRETLSSLDKHRRKISDAITSGIVNAAFCKDNIFSDPTKSSEFLSGTKEYGTLTAIATIGLVHLWDVDGCLLALDPYTYHEDEYIRGGALFGYGLSSSNVLGECDPVLAICSDCFTGTEPAKIPVQVGAVLGLGAAYAGTARRDIMDLFLKCLEQSDDLELNALCVLCTGIVGIGITCLLNWLMSQKENAQNEPMMILAAVGISMFYYRVKNNQIVKNTLESLHVLSKRMAENLKVLVLSVCQTGSGDMLKLQEILAIGYTLNADYATGKSGKGSGDDTASGSASAVTEGGVQNEPLSLTKKDADTPNTAPPAIALGILGIGLVSMGDDLSVDMAFRMLCQLLHIGHPESKKAVPLAIALLAISNPKLNFMDTLVKFAHDSDQMVSVNSIIALGLIGAGTNNARISAMLRQLSVFHVKDSVAMMSIRISQGFVHLGKGTMTLNPFKTDRFILNPVSMAGLIAISAILLEPRLTLSKYPHHLLLVMLAAHPRYLMAVDEETLKPISVSVRVGQAVDIVAQAGKPKTITGFQTHNTPVLLSYGERAELTTGEDEYISLSPIFEGVVLLKKKAEEEDIEQREDGKPKSVTAESK